MLFDKKGKLFGKVSIVDILILVIVLGVAAGLYYKFDKSGTVTPFTQTQTVQTTISMDSVNEYVIDNIKVGDVVRDKVQDIVMGKVVDIKKNADISYAINDKGLVEPYSRKGFCSAVITFEGQGIYSPTEVKFGGVEYYINKPGTQWRIGKVTTFALINDFKVVKE